MVLCQKEPSPISLNQVPNPDQGNVEGREGHVPFDKTQ